MKERFMNLWVKGIAFSTVFLETKTIGDGSHLICDSFKTAGELVVLCSAINIVKDC
jgi:hypothetical protein